MKLNLRAYVSLNVENGPRLNVLRSYSFIVSESTPAANMSPSGSNVPTAAPSTSNLPEQEAFLNNL